MRSDSLKYWDRAVSPRLNAIERSCDWIKHYSGSLEIAINALPCRPAWDTWARDELNKAETSLRTTLALIKAAQERYDNLPIILDAAE